ncbi:hypothetical protein HDU84_002159 [Entophlyctis sp. JEL0112]|nr:hypothetical protein HDU84_002159 [Entophlyctis sp. JEL0112]
MKRTRRNFDGDGAAGGSMLKYRKDDIDWASVYKTTQSRLMQAKHPPPRLRSASGRDNAEARSDEDAEMDIDDDLEDDRAPTNSTTSNNNTILNYFHRARDNITSLRQGQLEPRQHAEDACATCGIASSSACMGVEYASTQPLVICARCRALTCAECRTVCARCGDVVCAARPECSTVRTAAAPPLHPTQQQQSSPPRVTHVICRRCV